MGFLRHFLLFMVMPATSMAAVADWSSLISAAKSRHPELRAMREEEEAAQATASAAWGGYLPSVSLFADRQRAENRTSVLGVDTTTALTTDSEGVKVTWNLFKGFSTFGQSRRARALALGAKAGVGHTWLTVQTDLRKAYDAALLAAESARVYEGLQKRYRDQVKVIEAKYRSGLEAQWAVELARSNLLFVEATLNAEKLNLARSLETLGRLTGENYEGVRPDARFEKSPQPKRPAFRVEEHPRWRQAEAEERVATAEVTVARASLLPSLDLSWQNGRARPEGQDPATQTSYNLTLSYAIFEGFSGWNNASAARARARAAEIRLDESRKSLSEEEDQLWRQLDVNRQLLAAREGALRGARAYAETTSLQYRLGARKFAEWDTAQSRLLDAERDFLAARRLWLTSYADWEKAAGLNGESL
ncbi:MAG: TolC family protein [Bdellovibrionaceae bacterium]|nr:TolC family protein [Pseudobdellovibrionaceae bacterium]